MLMLQPNYHKYKLGTKTRQYILNYPHLLDAWASQNSNHT